MRTIDRKKTAERRQQILKAALRCFNKKGFHGASMSYICKEAKMSPGHLYHYFSSKEDLIEAIVEEDRKTAKDRVSEVAEASNTLETLIDSVHKLWQPNIGVEGALNAEITAEATRNKRIATIVIERNRYIRSIIETAIITAQEKGHISKDIDPEGFASFVMGITEGLTAMADADPGIDSAKITETIQLTWRKTLSPK